jgi:hypothetical protein
LSLKDQGGEGCHGVSDTDRAAYCSRTFLTRATMETLLGSLKGIPSDVNGCPGSGGVGLHAAACLGVGSAGLLASAG